jgi:hypothetical protein
MSFIMSVPYGGERVSETEFFSVSVWLIIRKDSIAIFVCYVGSVNVVDSRGRRTQNNGLHTVHEVAAWL